MSVQRKRIDASASKANSLAELRRKMPVKECAARLGVDFPTWYKWERGGAFPSLPYIWRIEDLLSKLNDRPITYREIWAEADPAFEGLE
jgi:transcriptional regulator with XRE-family HTH domain